MKARHALAASAALACIGAAAYFVAYLLPGPVMSRDSLGGLFVERPLPSQSTRELFDIGIADINGDDHLDIFSSNHNTRQNLWIADGKGGYRDMLTAWGLDQDPALPGAEIADGEPAMTEPGIYIHAEGRNAQSRFPLIIRAHRLNDIGRIEGRIRTHSGIGAYTSEGFAVQSPSAAAVPGAELPLNTVEFSADRDASLRLELDSPGAPVILEFGAAVPLASIYVGQQKVHPKSREIRFELQDRHGLAWSDLNGDGRLDVYITRGAIGGTLRKFPPDVQTRVQDELLVSQRDGRYVNVTAASGIDKRGCSARKTSWADFDRDGLLDLYVNCQERGFVAGQYPKQLYRQGVDGRFTDVAGNVGLDLPESEVIDFTWADIDNDGYPDLVTYEGKGFFLYRNRAGARFDRQFIGRGKFAREDRPQLRGTTAEYWFVDGKLAVADFDGDGYLDVFSASKMGNALLLNDGKGGLSLVDPTGRGLPDASATAVWVDFDNDGLVDLFAVPQGLYRQRPDHRFEATGLLGVEAGRYMAAIANWADLDNDGRRDLLLALLENFSKRNWWERLRKTNADRFTWHIAAYRNNDSQNRWLAVRLQGRPGNPQAIGARVTVQTAAGQQVQVVGLNDGAFFSQGHYRLYFGLGASERADSVRVVWPDGSEETFGVLEAERMRVLTQGAGR